jgi:hypothetical protein
VGSGAAGDPLAAGEPDAAGDPDAAGEPEASGELDAEGEPDAAGEPLGCGADTREIAHVPLMNSTDVPEVSTTASAPVPLPPPPVVGGSVADGEPSAPLVVLLALGVALAIGGSVVTLVPLVGDEFAVGPQAATAKAAAVAPMNKSLFPPTGASFLVIGRALNHTRAAENRPPARQ